MAGRCNCNQACNCCMQGSASVDVSGVGVPGECFRPEVAYSTEAGNAATAGADGGVFVGPPCLVDRLGNPLTPDPAGCLQIPPPSILNAGGQPITPNAQGQIQLPVAGTPLYGGGLRTLADGTLVVNTSGTWPTADEHGQTLTGGSADGAAIYLDTFGRLRAPASSTSVAAGAANTVYGPQFAASIASTFSTPASGACVVNNPSVARQMTVFRSISAIVDLITPQGGQTNIALEANYDGSGWQNLREVSWPMEIAPTGSTTIRFQGQVTQASSQVIGSADSHSVQVRVRVTKVGTGGNHPILIEVRCACQLWGVTR